jgi:hypothetical protein
MPLLNVNFIVIPFARRTLVKIKSNLSKCVASYAQFHESNAVIVAALVFAHYELRLVATIFDEALFAFTILI